MRSIYLNIGSNKGDRTANIERAVALISQVPVLKGGRIRRSPVVESKPVGFASDADFLNVGVALDFAGDELPCTPFELLEITQSIEKTIAPDSPHRNDDGTYRDRIADIDIIDIDGVKMNDERLTVPHPRAASRHFVVQPMQFLCPGWRFEGPSGADTVHRKKSIDEMGRDSLEAFKTKDKLPLALILDNIRSVNNVGSMFRTADAFCVETIALCGITATPGVAEMHKTALGAEQSVDWKHFDDTADAINELKKRGYTVLCLEQVHDSVSLEKFRPDTSRKYAVIVGNEVSGVNQAAVNMADVCIEIPQLGTKHSLNVSVSAAIALWHLFSKVQGEGSDI